MKKILITLSFIFPLIGFTQGGGWVGNSPIVIASNNTVNSFLPNSSYKTQGKVHNYFLTPEGEHAFDLGVGYTLSSEDRDGYLQFAADYSYGITQNLTFSAPFVFTYGLLNNQGTGSELAISAGISGIGYSSIDGLLVAPTLGLHYTWADNDLRFLAEVIAHQVFAYDSDRENDKTTFEDLYVHSRLTLLYDLTSWLRVSGGVGSSFQSDSHYSNSLHVGSEFSLSENTRLFVKGSAFLDEDSRDTYSTSTGINVSF